MKVKVMEITEEQSKLRIITEEEEKDLVINKTEHGHSYKDFTEWDITDEQYYELEELVSDVIKKMEGKGSITVEW